MTARRDWLAAAEDLWTAGRRKQAIDAVAAKVAVNGATRPRLYLQLAYYLFETGDFKTAARHLRQGHAAHPGDQEIALNLGVCLAKAGDHAAAIEAIAAYRARGGTDPLAIDVLARSCHLLGRDDDARAYGSQSLAMKDAAARSADPAPRLTVPPDMTGKRRIIAFTLFGDALRYLRGAVQNAARAPAIYPGWTCRFYLDETVPPDVVAALTEAGAEVVVRPSGEPLHRKLCWRFEVADDPDVGNYLVRDCDSVISRREALAVEDWIASNKPFHAMRDWWGHTDLMLAGMWGGVAGLLPPMRELIGGFAAGRKTTAHWDQWFLGARIWPLVRESIVVHDRIYDAYATRPFPGPIPDGDRHIGQNEYAARRDEQARKLARFAGSVPSLKLPPAQSG